jgi:hypothetical protein
MKTHTWLALSVLLVASAAMLGGCSHDPCASCACLRANCCGWEFYKPCDPLEGRDTCDELDPCLTPCTPQVMPAAPASQMPAAAPAPETAPPAPAQPAPDKAPASGGTSSSGDAPAGGPTADYGLPPDVR